MEQPWKTDKWFVSPWNYISEVAADMSFPERVTIHDITLRDGEQQAGVVFSKDEKVRIAAKLAEVGVHAIEAGMPAVSPGDEAAIKEIVRLKLGPSIFAFARCMAEDIKRAADCGVDGVVVEIPCSDHLIEYAYGWPLEKAIDLSIEATSLAKELGLYTIFFPIDATRAEMNWYLELIEKVATEGHMDALALVDTFGVLSPHSVRYFVQRTRERVKKPLHTHFHMDFGHGISNTIIALAAGAEVMQITVLGIGERAGNVPLEETVLTLLTMYNMDLGLKYDKLYELSKLVKGYSGQLVAANRPIVGDKIFQTETGIISAWVRRCVEKHPLEVYPFHWELVGHEAPELVLGKYSGTASVAEWLGRIGVEATKEEQLEMIRRVKAKSSQKKGLLDEGEFREIVEEVMASS